MPVLSNFVIEFRYFYIDNRMFKIITSVFIVTRRLEKHSILKFLRFKPLGHCNIFTFLLSFFFSWPSVCVGYLIDHVHVSLAFDFWRVFSEHLLFGIQCFKKHFVSISSVTFFFFMTFCVCWLLDRSCSRFFSIWFLACIFWASAFWHTVF